MTPEQAIPLRSIGGPAPAAGLSPLNCTLGEGGPLPAVPAATLAQITVVTRAQWPSVRVNNRGRAEAGPTGDPWVNANGWRVQMLAARDGKPVWLDTAPPADAPAASFPLAVADAAAYGGRWVVTATPSSWPAIQQALAFFEAHAEWRSWRPVARLGVASPFAGPVEFLAGEYLNLLSRRQIPYRLLREPADPDGLGCLVWLDRQPIPAARLEALLPWVRSGGLLLAPPGTRATPAPEEHGHRVYPEGQGRLAVAVKPWGDPYQAATATHLLFSRKNDTLRLWNAGSLNAHYVADPAGRRAVVHLLNYAVREASHQVTLWTAQPWRAARFTTLDGRSAPLKPIAANGGIELALPPVGPYAAIELES